MRLLCYFLDRGWAASARMVVTTLLQHVAPVASFQAVSSAVAGCHGEGLGLLHRAVRSGQLGAIIEVLGWAIEQQACLPWDSKGARGLTPLHLLALTGCKSSSNGAFLAAAGLGGSGAAPQSLASLVLQTSPGAVERFAGCCMQTCVGNVSRPRHAGLPAASVEADDVLRECAALVPTNLADALWCCCFLRRPVLRLVQRA